MEQIPTNFRDRAGTENTALLVATMLQQHLSKDSWITGIRVAPTSHIEVATGANWIDLYCADKEQNS